MKKYICSILLVSLIFSNVSCDRFLETESESTFDEKSVFETMDFARRDRKSVV